jgi:hypothetical protein
MKNKNYEKKYKEALEKARQLCDYPTTKPFISDLQDIFPELKESEKSGDEKIIMWLIRLISTAGYRVLDSDSMPCSRIELINWLKKQGEQKSIDNLTQQEAMDIAVAKCFDKQKSDNNDELKDYSSIDPNFFKTTDKAEPKFKVGDWCIDNEDGTIFQIVKVLDNTYTYKTNEGKEYFCTHYSLENGARLWSIKDAKAGDVLFQDLMGGKTFIYNGINPYMAVLYSFIISNDGEDVLPYHIGKPNTGIGNIEENKNIIHPATKEQRDLLFKKIKEAGYEWDAEKKELKKIEDEEYDGEDYGIDSLYHAQRILEKTLGKVDGYQSDDGILEHKCAISAVRKMYKQKPAWSKENDNCLSTIIAEFSKCSGKSVSKDEWMRCNDFLNSLKYRYTWKPTEEQMKALSNALSLAKNCGEESTFDLRTLYEQLKRL